MEAGVSGDQYFDEKSKSLVSITLPSGSSSALRALVPTARPEIGVTTLTEMAVGLIEASSKGGISTTTVDDIIAANNTIFVTFPFAARAANDDSPILIPPALINSTTTSLAVSNYAAASYAQLLAAFSPARRRR